MTTKENDSTCDSSAAEQMKFDWPEFLPEKRINVGIVEIAFGLFLFAALVAFCCFG
jgi:hypothetical protein